MRLFFLGLLVGIVIGAVGATTMRSCRTAGPEEELLEGGVAGWRAVRGGAAPRLTCRPGLVVRCGFCFCQLRTLQRVGVGLLSARSRPEQMQQSRVSIRID